MKTIVYKERGDRYECVAIKDSADELCAIVLDQPLDGKIKLGNRLFMLNGGVCRFSISDIAPGEYSPTLISNRRLYKMESLIFARKSVERKALGEEYLRALSERIHENSKRLTLIEERLARINEKFEEKINL